MQKRHKTWLIFSLLMYKKKKTRTRFLFQRQFLFMFFFTLPNTPLCTTFCLEKCSKCVFNRADYLILFQINILAIRKLTIDMFRRTNYKKKCIHGLTSATQAKKTRLLINTVYITTYRLLVCRHFKRYNQQKKKPVYCHNVYVSMTL